MHARMHAYTHTYTKEEGRWYCRFESGHQVLSSYGMDYSQLGQALTFNVGILFLLCLFYRFIAFASLKYMIKYVH